MICSRCKGEYDENRPGDYKYLCRECMLLKHREIHRSFYLRHRNNICNICHKPKNIKNGRLICTNCHSEATKSGMIRVGYGKKKIEFKCLTCGKMIKDYPRENRMYCSKKCRRQTIYMKELLSKINKGRKLSEESKEKMRKQKVRLICKFCFCEFYLLPWEARSRKYCSRKCSSAAKQKSIFLMCQNCCLQFVVNQKESVGRKYCSRKCMFEFIRKHPTSRMRRIRPTHNSWAYIKFTKRIFERDNYTCQICGRRGGLLQSDHYPVSFAEIVFKNKIKTMADAIGCSELWNINNGRTLCLECHKNTDTYGARNKFRRTNKVL